MLYNIEMVKMKYYFLLLLLLFIPGCEKENSIVNPGEDDKLKSNIVGQWKSSIFNITYYDNNTFIDSMSKYVDNNNVLNYVLKGKYEIKDSIINYYEFNIAYLKDTTSYYQYAVGKLREKIIYLNNQLFVRSINVLQLTDGQNHSIIGTWYEKYWMANYYKNRNPRFYGGYIETVYDFYVDSNKYTYKWKPLFDIGMNEYEKTNIYKYKYPFLSIAQRDSAEVKFYKNKMIWFWEKGIILDKVK